VTHNPTPPADPARFTTANWGRLLEAAMKELGYPDNVYRVTVTGDDLREPASRRSVLALPSLTGCRGLL